MSIAQFSQRIWLYFVMHQNIVVIWWHGYCSKKYLGATLDTLALFYFHNPYVLEIPVGKCICFSLCIDGGRARFDISQWFCKLTTDFSGLVSNRLLTNSVPNQWPTFLYTIIFHNRNCLIELFLPFISSMMPLSLFVNKYGILNALTPSKMTFIFMYSLQWR